MIDQHNSLAEKFLKKGSWLYLFNFIIAPIGYIIKIIVSSELTVSEVGILYSIISLITIISAYNDLGMTQSTLYFIPRYISEKRFDKVKTILTYSLLIQVITGILIASFFFFGADFLANNYFKNESASSILKIFSIFFFGINIFSILTTFFLAIQNTFLTKILELIRILFVLLTILLIIFLDLGNLIFFSYSWIIGLYLGILFGITFFYFKYHKTYFKKEKVIWSKKMFTPIFKYSLISFLGTQGATILSQIDMQMILFLLGTTEAGYYTNYLTLISMSLILIIPIFNILTPLFSELDSKNDNEKIINIKILLSKYFIIVGFALSIIFFIYNKEIAYIFFGKNYIISGELLRYSIFFLIFNILLQINFHLLGGIGKVKERTNIIYYTIILNIITNYILINKLGVYGAALATGMGWLFIWVMTELKIDKKYKLKLDYNFIIKNIVILSILGIFINNYITFPYNEYGKLFLFICILTVGVSLFLLFILFNLKETKKLIYIIKNK